MKILVRILIPTVVILAVVIFFQFRGDKKIGNLAPGVHQVKAEEVIQTSNYTYVRVSEDKKEYWCAINKTGIEEGKTFFWLKGWEMNQFHSKELDRTFISIFFLETLSDNPIFVESPTTGVSMAGRQKAPKKQEIKIDRADGGITIGELYANRKSYVGKSAKIRGEVVKFSSQIMNRNWVHIQDGTTDGNDYDLVITTQDDVSVGDIMVFEGVISLNVDFGSGYTYEVIMVDARVK